MDEPIDAERYVGRTRGVVFVGAGTGSWMEHQVFVDKYKVGAVSAVRVLELAIEQGKAFRRST